MQISLIAALAENRVIGVGNQMPWHLSADLRHFRALTLGKPILMGRKTFTAIGRPLPGRPNLILSSSREWAPSGCEVFNDPKEALSYAATLGSELMIIGGETLYRQFLPTADRLYLTLIHRAFDGDTFFPEYAVDEWVTVAREDINADPTVPFSYSFLTLERA